MPPYLVMLCLSLCGYDGLDLGEGVSKFDVNKL